MCVIRLCSFLLNAALGTTPHSKLLNPSPSFSLPPIAHYFFFLLVWKVFDELPLFLFWIIVHRIKFVIEHSKKNLNKSTFLIILWSLTCYILIQAIWKKSYCSEKIMQINLRTTTSSYVSFLQVSMSVIIYFIVLQQCYEQLSYRI